MIRLKMKDKKDVDVIVKMLDSLMEQGKGHVNLKVNQDGEAEFVDITQQTECSEGDVACSIPTMFYEDRETND